MKRILDNLRRAITDGLRQKPKRHIHRPSYRTRWLESEARCKVLEEALMRQRSGGTAWRLGDPLPAEPGEISTCCGAAREGGDFCSACGEHAEFVEEGKEV